MLYGIDGKSPQIHATCFVAPNAAVIGEVTMAPNSSVWFGCVLRGDAGLIEIGEGTNVQDGSIIHERTRLGKDCVVGHGAVIHAATVGDRVLVANRAVVLDGCEIGDGCIIGAGAIVPPRTKVPPNTMWLGVPAKQVRELTSENQQMTARLAAGYQRNRGRYLDSLQAIEATAAKSQ